MIRGSAELCLDVFIELINKLTDDGAVLVGIHLPILSPLPPVRQTVWHLSSVMQQSQSSMLLTWTEESTFKWGKVKHNTATRVVQREG